MEPSWGPIIHHPLGIFPILIVSITEKCNSRYVSSTPLVLGGRCWTTQFGPALFRAAALWHLRLEAPASEPDAFASSPDDHRATSIDHAVARPGSANNFVVGALVGTEQ